MTYVGKILVIVIMVFAVGFLFLSTMVFMTERDWKKEVERLKADQSKLVGKLGSAEEQQKKLQDALTGAEKTHAVQVKQLEGDITNLKNETSNRTNEITDQRKAIETAQQNLRSSQQNAEAKDQETAKIREQFRTVQNEANAYKLQQLELKDKIRTLELQLEAAQRNNSTLREDNLALQNIVKENNLNPDPKLYQRRNRPLPVVDGEILRADNQNKRYQISVGRDDGIDHPDKLYVYRLKPKPEYLGELQVQTADNDQAVATLVGQTVQGKKIQEGDIVSTTLRARD
jgi:rRNA maturation endonuclease Nob1